MTAPRTVVITGASRGLGLASAVHLYKLGWRVVAGMRSVEAGLERLRAQTGADANDPRLLGVRLDLDDAASIATAAEAINSAVGSPDVLVHNAGIAAAGSFEDNDTGGAQFYAMWNSSSGTAYESMMLSYEVAFDSGFDWRKGGKLPGLRGGPDPNNCSGGHQANGTNCFTTRLMWRTNGEGELYAYLPSSEKYGTSLKRGSFSFTPGQWHCIEQELTLNTPGKPDGVVRGWLDGKSTFQQEGLLFRTVPSLRIEGVFFSTFFGGSDTTWASTADTHIDFADFATGPTRVGCDSSK